jgi:hypothetical protein
MRPDLPAEVAGEVARMTIGGGIFFPATERLIRSPVDSRGGNQDFRRKKLQEKARRFL